MRCSCGMEFGPGEKFVFARHRQQCRVFWQDIKTKMEGISRKLRGEITPVSSREWDMRRPRDLPSSKTLIDWLGKWSAVQERIGHGVLSPGHRATEAPPVMPSIDDFAKMVMRLSEHYSDGHIIGGNAYDDLRPKGWPQYRTMLRQYGYALDQHGWRQFVFDHIGLSVVGNAEAQRIAAERKLDRIAIADGAHDDRETHAAMLYRSGLPICETTYLRTGRMFVR